ncbi:MAG: 6-bladed beta-propeller [Cytophagia bacterium]|nr:6-bladed beta-propeller [Cytophagia bacterium]
MHTRLLITSLLIFSLFHACSSSDPKEKDSSFHTYSVNLSGTEKHFFEQIESLSLTVLEETDSSLFGTISNIELHGSSLYVVEGKQRRLFQFSNQGKFLALLNSVGEGPNEYLRITDLSIKEGKITILDQPRQRVSFWTQNLQFIDSEKLGFSANNFQVLNDGTYLFDNSYILPNDTTFSSLIVTNHDFSIQRGLIPFSHERQLGFANNSIQQLDEGYYYRPIYNDTVYFISQQTSTQPLFKLDFGEFWRLSNEFKTDNELFQAYREEGVLKKDMVFWLYTWVNKDRVFLRTILFPSYTTIGTLIDRETGKSINLDLSVGGDPRAALRLLEFNLEGKNYMELLPSQLEELLEYIPEEEIRIVGGKTLKDALNNENPGLLSFTFKGFD